MAESGGSVVDSTPASGRSHVQIPLNSKRITAGQLCHLGLALGITVSGSISDQRLLGEGQLNEGSHDPCNVQVVFEEYSSEAAFVLWDEDGEFLSVPAAESVVTDELPEPTDHESARSSVEPTNDADNLETLRQAVADITSERNTLQMQLQQVTAVLEQKKARIKELWRMSCGQVEEYDTMVVAKDNEIAAIKAQLAEQEQHRTPNSSDDDTVSIVQRHKVIEKQRAKDSRRGRAPSIDLFTGEDSSIRLDDWLPGLNLASRWNGWTPEEKLIQLAGHLRGRAEAEWNLLSDDESRDFDRAIHNLRERLDPCSKVFAGQDFRRTV